MQKKEQTKEELNTNLFQKISKDKADLIVTLKEERDKLLSKIQSEYVEMKELKKEKKEIRKKIRILRRSIVKDENERFSLNRQLDRQIKLSNTLNIKYSNETDEVINTQKFYPETSKKIR